MSFTTVLQIYTLKRDRGFFQNTEQIHRVLPVPNNHLLGFQGIECKLYYSHICHKMYCNTINSEYKLPYKNSRASAVPSPFGPIVCLFSQAPICLNYLRYNRFLPSTFATYFICLSHPMSLGEGYHVNHRGLSVWDLTVREHWGENMVLCTRIWWWEPPPTNRNWMTLISFYRVWEEYKSRKGHSSFKSPHKNKSVEVNNQVIELKR